MFRRGFQQTDLFGENGLVWRNLRQGTPLSVHPFFIA